MKRRLFLKNIPVVGYLLIEMEQAFGQVLQNILPIPGKQLPNLTIQREGKAIGVIPILWKNQLAYISTRQLAEVLQYQTYFNDNQEKD